MNERREMLEKLQADLVRLAGSGELNDEVRGHIATMQDDVASALAMADAELDFGERWQGMVSSYQVSHPRLTAFVDQVASTLSNMGL